MEEFRSGNESKSEVGPVVVPKEWDYAATKMRKGERLKVRIRKSEFGMREGEKEEGGRELNSEFGMRKGEKEEGEKELNSEVGSRTRRRPKKDWDYAAAKDAASGP